MKNFKELEDGGIYKNRKNETCIVKKRVSDKDGFGVSIEKYPFCNKKSTFTLNGDIYYGYDLSNNDLIEKIWTKNFTELKDGGVYKSRSGEIVTVKKRVSENDGLSDNLDAFPFSGSGSSYSLNGRLYNNFIESNFDLIEKIGQVNSNEDRIEELECKNIDILLRLEALEEDVEDLEDQVDKIDKALATPVVTTVNQKPLMLCVGKTYKNRNGEEVKIIREVNEDNFPWYDYGYQFIGANSSSDNLIYMSNGYYMKGEVKSKDDLIEEVEPIKRNFETLEVGRRYKRRCGDIRTIETKTHDNKYPFRDKEKGVIYCKNGDFWDTSKESPYDLIELLPEEKPTFDNDITIGEFIVSISDGFCKYDYKLLLSEYVSIDNIANKLCGSFGINTPEPVLVKTPEKPKFEQWDVVMYEGKKYLFICYHESKYNRCVIEKWMANEATIVVPIYKVTKA